MVHLFEPLSMNIWVPSKINGVLPSHSDESPLINEQGHRRPFLGHRWRWLVFAQMGMDGVQ